ncbi:hypothetical protein GF361_00630 [Candidatus Woesearchaeota archaeon]|nr:hypothetical protein [Candidatus Woesearchaeota archaeon]
MNPEELARHAEEGSLYSKIMDCPEVEDSDKDPQKVECPDEEATVDTSIDHEMLIGTAEQETNRDKYFNNEVDESYEKDISECKPKDLTDYVIKEIGKDRYAVVLPVTHKRGIHLSPASVIAEKANKYESSMFMGKYAEISSFEDVEFNVKRVIDVMSSGLSYKKRVMMVSNGNDAEKSLDAMKELFQDNFGLGD